VAEALAPGEVLVPLADFGKKAEAVQAEALVPAADLGEVAEAPVPVVAAGEAVEVPVAAAAVDCSNACVRPTPPKNTIDRVIALVEAAEAGVAAAVRAEALVPAVELGEAAVDRAAVLPASTNIRQPFLQKPLHRQTLRLLQSHQLRTTKPTP